MKQAPAVLLVRPTEAGNVGAVARAMANTGLDRLVLIEPAVGIDAVARARAAGGLSILESARRCASLEEALAPFRMVIGTSSQRDRTVRAQTVTPRQLPERMAGVDPADVALLFGPERTGLTTKELVPCASIVCIPTASEQPTLNLAQAVLIVAYELWLATEENRVRPHADPANQPAPAAAVAGLFEHADSIFREVGFARDSTYRSAFLDLERLAARAAPSEREVAILRGLCRRLEHALHRREPIR